MLQVYNIFQQLHILCNTQKGRIIKEVKQMTKYGYKFPKKKVKIKYEVQLKKKIIKECKIKLGFKNKLISQVNSKNKHTTGKA